MNQPVKKEVADFYDPLDKPMFGMTLAHPRKEDLKLDPFAGEIEEMAARAEKAGSSKDVTWDQYDKEMEIVAQPLATLTLFRKTMIISRDDLEWLVVQGKALLDGMDEMAKIADRSYAKYRRSVRGEVPNAKLGEKK